MYNTVQYRHYRKEMANTKVVLADSAMPYKTKKVCLALVPNIDPKATIKIQEGKRKEEARPRGISHLIQ